MEDKVVFAFIVLQVSKQDMKILCLDMYKLYLDKKRKDKSRNLKKIFAFLNDYSFHKKKSVKQRTIS